MVIILSAGIISSYNIKGDENHLRAHFGSQTEECLGIFKAKRLCVAFFFMKDIFLLLSELTVVVCCVHLHQSNEEEEKEEKKRKMWAWRRVSAHARARVHVCAAAFPHVAALASP